MTKFERGKHLKLRWNLMRKLNGNLVWKLNGIFKTYGHNIFQNFVLVKRLNCFKTTSMTIKCLQCRDIFVKSTFIYMCFDRKKLRFIFFLNGNRAGRNMAMLLNTASTNSHFDFSHPILFWNLFFWTSAAYWNLHWVYCSMVDER